MDIPQLDYKLQALRRLAQQYVGKPKLEARLTEGTINGILRQGIGTAVQDIDQCIQAMADRLNVKTATGNWLDICGWLVGVKRVLPNGTELTDEPFRTLVLAKIARNHCQGDVPNMIEQLRLLFERPGESLSIDVQDVGKMTMHAQIGRRLTNDERSVLAITSGISRIPGGILPKPMGVRLTLSDVPTSGVFSFSDLANPGVPLSPNGQGFSTLSTPTGEWAGVIL